MAITTSAGDGVRITTSAWCGVANSGTATTAVINGRWGAGGNSNNGNTDGCFASFTDRLILIRKGTCTEETRYVINSVECATCDTTTVTVHEAWCTNPAACDSVDISYIIQDAATVTGLGLINKRVQDYSSTRKFRIGNSGACPTFAYFALLNGASLESVDNSSATCPDLRVENNGRFSNGYIANNVGVSGGYIILTPAIANELGIEVLDGAQLDLQDRLFVTSVNNPEFRILGSCTTGTAKIKNVLSTNQFEVTANNVCFDEVNITGKDGTCDVLDVGNNVTMSCVLLTNMGPIRNENQNCTNETFTFKNITFVSNAGDIITVQGACSNNKHFILENPDYTNDPPTCDITLLGACSDVVERFTVTATSQQTDGTKIQNTRFKITEVCPSAALVNEVNSDVCGIASLPIIKREWAGVCETLTTHANFALKTYDYGFQPFVTSQTVANQTGGKGQVTTITQLTDDFVCAAECVAVADGTTKVTIIESTACNNHSLVKWTSGTGTLTSGDTIRQCATNLGIVHIIEGDSCAGTGIIVSRTTTNVANCSTLCTAGGWCATYTNSSELRFYYVYDAGAISCVDRTAQQVYDHQIAKLGEGTLDTTDSWCKPILWGRAEHAIPLQGVSCAGTICATFKTVRNVATTQGWGIIGLDSLGKIDVFTSDDGTEFSPQASVTVTVTVNDENGNAVQGARVGVFTCPVSAGDTALLCGTTNACGVVTGSLTVAGDISANVRVRLKGYLPFETTGTISSSTGLSVGVRFIRDTSVNLP